MTENKKEPENESDVIKAIKEEYENKITTLVQDFQNQIKEIEEKNVRNIRALMTGEKKLEEKETKEDTESDFDKAVIGLAKQYHLKNIK